MSGEKQMHKSYIIPPAFRFSRVPGQVPTKGRMRTLGQVQALSKKGARSSEGAASLRVGRLAGKPEVVPSKLTAMPGPLTEERLLAQDMPMLKPSSVSGNLGLPAKASAHWAKFLEKAVLNSDNEVVFRKAVMEKLLESGLEGGLRKAIFSRAMTHWRTVQKSRPRENEYQQFVVTEAGLNKALFIGPRGGKWADAKHSIPWTPPKGKKIHVVEATGEDDLESQAVPEKVGPQDDIERLVAKLPDYGKPGLEYRTMSAKEKNAFALMEQRGYAVISGKGKVNLTTKGKSLAQPIPEKPVAPATEITIPEKPEEAGNRGRSDYEERQESRRERFELRADKARDKAAASRQTASQTASGIPMGQPILVGHHSEARARRDQAKIHRKMGESVQAQQQAERLDERARSVGRAGISSDDPEAVQKLQTQIDAAEAQRDMMKKINRSYAKHKGDWAAIQKDTGASDRLVKVAQQTMRVTPHEKKPIPAYAFTNLGANIRRMKKRIESMRQEAATVPRPDVQGKGYKVVENTDANRLQIVFDGKPPADVRKTLKQNGFKWSPREGAWQRLLNNNARHAADYVLKEIAGDDEPAVQQAEPTPEIPAVDSTLWESRPVFGVAGGPDEVLLTEAGRDKAAKVATGLKPGVVAALEDLPIAGESVLIEQEVGATVRLTSFGAKHTTVIGELIHRGLAELAIDPDRRERAYRLTAKGKQALQAIQVERDALLARVKASIKPTPESQPEKFTVAPTPESSATPEIPKAAQKYFLEVVGFTARIVDAKGDDVSIVGDIRDPVVKTRYDQLVKEFKPPVAKGPATTPEKPKGQTDMFQSMFHVVTPDELLLQKSESLDKAKYKWKETGPSGKTVYHYVGEKGAKKYNKQHVKELKKEISDLKAAIKQHGKTGAAKEQAAARFQLERVVGRLSKLTGKTRQQLASLVPAFVKGLFQKAEARGGDYHRRIPNKSGKGYRYFYSPEDYDKRDDAHTSGEDAGKAYLGKCVHKCVGDAGPKGCGPESMKDLVKKHGSKKVAGILRDSVKGGTLAFKKGKFSVCAKGS